MSAARPETILLVEDDEAMRRSCEAVIVLEGFAVQAVESCEAAQALLEGGARFRAVLTDLMLPGSDGLQVLRTVKRLDPGADVVVMTGYATIQTAVEAMRLGAMDYVTKPFEVADLIRCLDKVRRSSWVDEEVERLRQELADRPDAGPIVAASPEMLEVLALVRASSQATSSVLIEGESGTGKELIARAIHDGGPRRSRPYVPVSCAALPLDLVESELFGHRAGSFTGAMRDSEGLFRAAQGGTLFLDEVTEVPLATQVKLLRVLQEKLVRPVGEVRETPVDVRIIAATNRFAAEAVAEGRLREDLYYRLSVIVIRIPPLRERPEDIPPLVGHFVAKHSSEERRERIRVDPAAFELLERYPWPGNVRELENVIEGILALGRVTAILPAHLPKRIREHGARAVRKPGGEMPSLHQAERELIQMALRESGGNKAAAARILGISRQRLYRMAREHGIRL